MTKIILKTMHPSDGVCEPCEKAKALLKENKIPFALHELTRSERRAEYAKHPPMKTVPIAINAKTGKLIGGYPELKKAIENGEV